jgi:hypothetical protein
VLLRSDLARAWRGATVDVVEQARATRPLRPVEDPLRAGSDREDPEQQIQEDLRRFKQLAETGEIIGTEGQTSGR